MRGLLYAVLALFFVLRYDLWLWDDARIIAGLPAGLLFHVAYCLVAAALLGLLALLWALLWALLSVQQSPCRPRVCHQ